jgi:hypothetical protein
MNDYSEYPQEIQDKLNAYDNLMIMKKFKETIQSKGLKRSASTVISQKKYYEKCQADPEKRKKNNQRIANIQKKKYNNDPEERFIKLSKSAYSYYSKKNNIETFKEKYPDRFQKLIEINFIKN